MLAALWAGSGGRGRAVGDSRTYRHKWGLEDTLLEARLPKQADALASLKTETPELNPGLSRTASVFEDARLEVGAAKSN